MVLRRYTPPTCTLEITAKKSPLSRWTNQEVLKDLSFQLTFDDPRLTTEEQVVIKGDREQLEALCKVVETYIQNFLTQSTNLLNSALLTPAIESNQYLAIAENNHSQGRENNINPDEELPDNNIEDNNKDNNKFQIYIKPKGLLNHELFLGTLAEDSISSINLTALQLFDLANALDEYNNDIVTLPEIDRRKWLKTPPVWVSIAAVLVLTVGLTPTIVKLLNRSSTQQVASNVNQNQPLPNAQQINSAVNPIPGQIPPPLPPGVSPILTPPGTVPTPNKNAAPNSQNSTSAPTPTATPTLLQPPPIPTTTNADVNKQNSGEKSPPPVPAPGQQQIVINPQPAVIPDIIPSTPASQTPVNNAPAPEPFFFPTAPKTTTQPPLPEPIITSQTPREEAPKPLKPAPQPNTNGVLPPARLPEVNLENDKYSGGSKPESGRSQNSTIANTNISNSNISDPTQVNSARKIASPSLPIGSSDGISSNTVFGNNPQVMEIKDYFQKRWTPPQDLNRTLEYTLLLNNDGSIKEVKALTEISAKYIDSTNMPSIGQPFVSASEGKNTPKIRLFLSPDGKVQTFLESSN